jgi:hypothetical protein
LRSSSVILDIVALSANCFSFVLTDCWLVVFENVGHKAVCEHNILCFAKTLRMLEEPVGKAAMKKWHQRFHEGHETAGVFCTLVVDGQEIP